ncbi:unnamed protein product [Lampetra planeri]
MASCGGGGAGKRTRAVRIVDKVAGGWRLAGALKGGWASERAGLGSKPSQAAADAKVWVCGGGRLVPSV